MAMLRNWESGDDPPDHELEDDWGPVREELESGQWGEEVEGLSPGTSL